MIKANILIRSNRNTQRANHGLTIMEMVIALSIMTVVLASVMPMFAQIRTGWDSKQAAAETLQNGRILIDHINMNLSKAVKITAVSGPTDTDGYIEFEDNDAETIRYDINNSTDYVEYGIVGDLGDLAGPVESLQFVCYDGNDFDNSITDVNSIRYIEIETVLVNPESSSQDKTFTAAAYLRVNGFSGSGSTTQTIYDYSNQTQGTDIFAYDGENNTQVPATSTTPTDVFSSGEYDNIEFNDGDFHTYSTSSNSKYAQMRFVIQIDEDENDLTQIVAVFNGKGINTKQNSADGASLYIWNYTYSDYELLEASADTEDEITLTGTLSSSLPDYIGESGQDTLVLLVATNSKKANKNSLELLADYVQLEISAASGGSGIYP